MNINAVTPPPSSIFRHQLLSLSSSFLHYFHLPTTPLFPTTRSAAYYSSSNKKTITLRATTTTTRTLFIVGYWLLLRNPISSSCCAWLLPNYYYHHHQKYQQQRYHHHHSSSSSAAVIIGQRRRTPKTIFSFSSTIKTTTTAPTEVKTTATTRLYTTSTSDKIMSITNSEQSYHKYKFVDIGANLLAEQFIEGKYFGKIRHQSDLKEVLQRSIDNNVTHLIITAGTLQESKDAIEFVRKLRKSENSNLTFGCTVGIHPTRCQQEFLDRNNKEDPDELSPTDVLEELKTLALDGMKDHSVVAIGEIGLDYDRLEFCPKDVQQEYLEKQLTTFHSVEALQKLPLFLHNRNVGTDLLEVLKAKMANGSILLQGVVHSFDDTLELATSFIELGLYIGLNGCSLKTQSNLDVVQKLPLDRILIETDCPYCEIKKTHASYKYIKTHFVDNKKQEKKFELGKMVKGRNEPCQLIQVAEVIAGVKGLSLEEVANQCYENSMKLYSQSFSF